MKLSETLFKLLILDGNETNFIENEQTYNDFKLLIIETVKAKENIRYCSRMNCSCHPESSIRKILKNKDLEKFFKKNGDGVLDELKEWINNYSPIISKKNIRKLILN